MTEPEQPEHHTDTEIHAEPGTHTDDAIHTDNEPRTTSVEGGPAGPPRAKPSTTDWGGAPSTTDWGGAPSTEPVPAFAPSSTVVTGPTSRPLSATEIVCPQCATINDYVELIPHADNFCTECDFPLFWDQMTVAIKPSDERSDDALRRLPGVAGRDMRQMRPCLECSEPNPLAADNCVRCGASMDPAPPPPPPPPPALIDTTLVAPGRDWMLFALLLLVVALTAWMVWYGVAGT